MAIACLKYFLTMFSGERRDMFIFSRSLGTSRDLQDDLDVPKIRASISLPQYVLCFCAVPTPCFWLWLWKRKVQTKDQSNDKEYHMKKRRKKKERKKKDKETRENKLIFAHTRYRDKVIFFFKRMLLSKNTPCYKWKKGWEYMHHQKHVEILTS